MACTKGTKVCFFIVSIVHAFVGAMESGKTFVVKNYRKFFQ